LLLCAGAYEEQYVDTDIYRISSTDPAKTVESFMFVKLRRLTGMCIYLVNN